MGPTGTTGVVGPTGTAGTFTGNFAGDSSVTGNFTVTGNLNVTGAINNDAVWSLIQTANLTSSADYTFSGLNGDTYSRYRIEAEGTFFVGGADKAIGMRPNADTTLANYVQTSGYLQHTPNGSQSFVAAVGLGTVGGQMVLCHSNFNTDVRIFCAGEMSTKSGAIRVSTSEGTDVTSNTTCGGSGVGCISRTFASAGWRSTANITSLLFTFNGATGFNGTIKLYGKK
jgi:hypothetical protein